MRVLSVTTLFPNAANPRFGIFIANRLNKLKCYHNLDLNVVAPLPWFPLASMIQPFSYLKKVPVAGHWQQLGVRYPRFLSIPGYGFGLKPKMIAKSILSCIAKDEKYDLLDAHYAYPDGAAAAIVAKYLNIPMVLSVRGSDINELPKNPAINRAIQYTLQQTDHVIAVSRPLANAVKKLRSDVLVSVIENGVDKKVFYHQEKIVRQENLLLSVGNLISLKGHELVISALTKFPDWELVVIGGGAEQARLESIILQKQLSGRVRIIENMTQPELAEWYNKAAVTMLASANEGCPNVVLESIACGTPVIATRVGACEDLIDEGASGLFIEERSVEGVVMALQKFCRHSFEPKHIEKLAEKFNWHSVCGRQLQIYHNVIESRRQVS